MNVRFSWNLEDAKTFVHNIERPNHIFKFSYWFAAIVFTSVGVGNLLLNSEFKAGSAIFLLCGLATLYWLTLGRQFQAKNLWKKRQAIKDNYEINDTGIKYFCSDSEQEITDYKWNDFSLFIESNSHFLLYDDGELLMFLPKRAFVHQHNIEQFRVWASQINS